MNVFCLLHIEADLIQAKDHLLTLLSGHMTEGQRSALCLLQQLCRIDGKRYLKKFVMHFLLVQVWIMKFQVSYRTTFVGKFKIWYIHLHKFSTCIYNQMLKVKWANKVRNWAYSITWMQHLLFICDLPYIFLL